MALFDFDELEYQVKSASASGGPPRAPRPAPSTPAAGGAAATAVGTGHGATARAAWAAVGTARPGPQEARRPKAVEALGPGGFAVLLKRYESAEVERVPAHRDLTVQALLDALVRDHGLEPSVKLVGGSSGARDRYQRRQRGWALEGHGTLDASLALGSLTCSALLAYQRRAGPVAELDLREMAQQAEEERRAREAAEASKRAAEERWRRDAEEAALRAEAERAQQRAHEAQEETLAQEAGRAAEEAPQPPGGGAEADLLAEALQVELEVERRLQLGAGEAKGKLGALMEVFPPRALLPPRAGAAWGQPEPVYFVDALNETLSQTKRVIEMSTKYSTKVLEEVAEYFCVLCHVLNLLVLCSFPAGAARHLQSIFSTFTKPVTGIGDLTCAWCDAVTLAKGRTPLRLHSSGQEAQRLNSQNAAQAVANARREMQVTLRGLHRVLASAMDSAEHGTCRQEALAALRHLEDVFRRRSPSSTSPHLGPMRVMRTTPVIMTRLLCDLRKSFKDSAFQDEYRELPRGDARVMQALTVQRAVLPKHGFSGDFRGVRNMRAEVGGHTTAGDHVVWKLMKDIHQLLDVAGDAWHEEVLTLDFGNASRVEQEVSLLYQQDFALTNLEKLVGARLAAAGARGDQAGLQAGPSARAGLELFFARLCAPKARQPLPPSALAALAAAARELYAAMGGPRRRLALNSVQGAVGCRAARRAVAVAELLRLGEEPAVASRRRALETLDSQVLQCFQNQPELGSYVGGSVLASRWQRGELELEDTEAGGEAALHLAAGDGSLELVGALLVLGARVDRRDRLGRTPAHWAAACGHAAVLAALADRGADLNAADAHGRTPRGFMVKGGGERRPAASLPRWCD